MSCDKLVFDLSQEIEGSPSVFVKKDWINILDNQNQNYNSNQSVIDTSQLANSNKYMSYREAYLAMPLLLTVATTTAVGTGFTPLAQNNDMICGLKNWFGSMIHSFTLDYQGTTVIQQTHYINMWNTFKLMTSLSWEDVATQGATIGFYPDDPSTFLYQAGASFFGQGICNNALSVPTSGSALSVAAIAAGNGIPTAPRAGLGNDGFTRRLMNITFDPTQLVATGGATIGATLQSSTACNNLWKTYVSTKVNGAGGQAGILQISILATIYLKHIHSFFSMVPLLKGVFMKMTMNLNNTTTQITSSGVAGTLTLVSTANAVGGVCPLMVGQTIAGQGAGNLGATTVNANISVGSTNLDPTTSVLPGMTRGQLASSVYLYIPAYTFNPVFEQAYLSSPVKQIKYTDVYQYQVLNVGANAQFNNLLTNGIANIKSVLLLPFFSASAGAANTGIPVGIPVYQSPFDPAGCGATSPLIAFSNFNVVVSGQNAIYNTQRYSFEQFNNQLYGVSAVNGGMTDGLTSSLIDRMGFDTEYCYYYVNVSRMLPVEESVPKSIQIIGTNQSLKAVDLWCFIEYGVDISIDLLTGSRV